MKEDRSDADVLVIGAGMAGLSAARSLAVSGASTVVLEAQGRIGGRIYTQRIDGEVIELGAEFVHGRPLQLLELIKEAGLELVERAGSVVHSHEGGLSAGDDAEIGDEDPYDLLEQLESSGGPDMSFAEFLDAKRVPPDKRDAAIGFVEGFNAADHHVISAQALGLQQKAEDLIEGDRSFHVRGGYDQLPDFLARKFVEHGGQLRLGTKFKRIEWKPGRAVVHTNQGSFFSSKVIIALPLGVLLSGDIEFDTALPIEVSNILVRNGPIRSGTALRFTMIFRERFWQMLAPQPALSELSFLIGRATVPSVWWTARPEISNALTGWIGGPRAEQLAGLSAEALAERGCDALARIFQLQHAYIRSMLTGCFSHDWSADPNAMGAYSYVAKGGLDASGVLGQPISDTLYFAGEHTATDGHLGTVHAALASGLRAAAQITALTGDKANTKPAISR